MYLSAKFKTRFIMEKDKLMANPFYVKALEYIKNNDLNKLEVGKHVIDGDNLWVNIVDSVLKTVSEAKLEVHDKYIDVQVPLSAPESFGVAARANCKQPVGEMDPVKDILFFSDKIKNIETVEAGHCITFAPDEAHAPLIETDGFAYPINDEGKKLVHKAIFKVKVI